ncbi:hypothetical protein AB1Y20_009296 [Prymnesium parvum]|uniref:Uncharacterized protein n=1 Tax=Prymnesium parvum TaxID=97485 RepID=A0AB34K3T1_PRYPA
MVLRLSPLAALGVVGATEDATCHGHNWRWYGADSCGAPDATPAQRARHARDLSALSQPRRAVFISSLTYGGSDQMSVSTVHLARELNVLNLACDALRERGRQLPCPLVFVPPLVRDLTPAAKAHALYLFPEPSRRAVPLGRLFHLPAARACSHVRLVDGIASLPPRVPTHLVLPLLSYGGPLLSHTRRGAARAMLDDASHAHGDAAALARLLRAFDAATERFAAAAAAHAARTGVELQAVRFTVLPDPPKAGHSPEWRGGPEHRCSPPGLAAADGGGCGAQFLQQVARHEPNGSLVLFLVTESSQQNDLPSHRALRAFWQPSGRLNRTLASRLRSDERAVGDCLRLAPRFDQAVEKMLELSAVAPPVAAWQLRAEKLSLVLPGQKGKDAASAISAELLKSIQRQVRTVQSACRGCGVKTILLESDLLRQSATMLKTIFGVQANSSAADGRLRRLRDAVLRGLRSWPKGASAAIRVTTTDALLAACRGSVPQGHPLEPFVRDDGGLLEVERTLFAVSVMARTTYLIRSPVTSAFSGWANTIRVANGGPSMASWGTDDGIKWWKCVSTSHLKLGKCRTPSKTERAPRLCSPNDTQA